MNTNDRCRLIIERIIELTNDGREILFKKDLGGNTLTLFIDGYHWHVGVPYGSFNKLVESLSKSLYLEWDKQNEK